MKKKLEADLISIAHRILQMKNKSDLDQLFAETQKLYEKLAVLRFVEEHFAEAKPTIGRAEIEAALEDEHDGEEAKATPDVAEAKAETPATDEHAVAAEAAPEADESEEAETTAEEKSEETPEVSNEEDIVEEEAPSEEVGSEENEAAGEAEDEAGEEPADEEPGESQDEPEPETDQTATETATATATETETATATPKTQITFDDLMMHHYDEPVFVKANDNKEEISVPETPLQPEAVAEAAIALEGTPELEAGIEEVRNAPEPEKFEAPKPAASTDNSKSIVIGLNDRIGFEKHLFGGSGEDLNRVLSQLNTFGNFDEAKAFIDDMVKPDYNHWTGKEDYEQRFLDIVERKFN